ncbi:MAG: serine-type D-Ala-D-Ala carboxypeptidase [Gammaproteobacteria bacterium]|nr:MAG: serine-type D-Ala-D-Ala carboxypeptidase [Gammaproteobacteria bacterium]RLA20815.1 MAG: serine-type D-Ala-D-Ala carboxypeptidase [Gammaproteobacteria bacterium]
MAVTPIPAAPRIAASGFFLQDFNSGKVLAEKNSEQRLPPASLTKIMTSYIAFNEIKNGQLNLSDLVTISEKAWRTPGSRMFIEVGKKIPVEELLKGMVIQSGNDASVALAEHIAGDEQTFAQMMNQQAEKLGMTNSWFSNSTGLPTKEDHYTTAQDLSRLTLALIRDFPEFYSWYSEKEMTFNGITQKNRNRLLWRDKSVDGVKTGHTDAAKYCLVSSSLRDGMRLISVVMGTSSENARAQESQALINYGYRFYETHRLYQAGETLTSTRIWKGSSQQLNLGLSEDLYLTIPRKQYKNLDAQMELDPRIMAPAAKGQQFGVVTITLDGTELARKPLIALSPVTEGSIFQRLSDEALLMIE